MGDEINRAVELQLRAGVNVESSDSRIKEIKDDGTVKMLSPMSGGRPRQVRAGTPINIAADSLGAESMTATVMAVEQLHDEELDEWVVTAEQSGEPEDWVIKRRGFARERASFPVEEIKIVGQEEPKFEALCNDLSGSGIRLSLELETRDAISRGTELELDFSLAAILDEQGDVVEPAVKLPLLKGTVVRLYPQESRVGGNQWIVGVEFADFEGEDDEVQNDIIRYILKLQIRNQANLDE